MKTSERIIVESFLSLSDVSRLEALQTILNQQGIDYTIDTTHHRCKNVFIRLTDAPVYTLFIAHYDVYPGSLGINDNTCALALLINLSKKMLKTSCIKPINILFTDMEETGMVGSSHFIQNHKNEIEKAIVFDIIGYGDAHFHCSSNPERFNFLNAFGIKTLMSILPSDNIIFEQHGITTTLITAAHQDDVMQLREKYSLNAYPKFYESFHNQIKDNNLSLINFPLIEQLGQSLTAYALTN